MFAFTACNSKGNSTTPTSPDEPKSGIEGTWVAIDTSYYNDSEWREIVGRDVALSDKEDGTTPVYIFRNGKMSALWYNGILDGDYFLYVKGDDTSAPDGVAVDYWMEDGVFYNSLMPEGCKITFLDNKHMQMEDGYLLRKVDKLQPAPSQNPMCNTSWAGCDYEDGSLSLPTDVYYFGEDNRLRVWFFDDENAYSNGEFTLNEAQNVENSGMYIYAPNNNEIYIGWHRQSIIGNFLYFGGPVGALQMMQEGGETYLVYAVAYKYGGYIMRKYKKVNVTLVSK